MHNFLIPLNWIKVKLEEMEIQAMLKNEEGLNYRLNLIVYVSQLAKRILYFSPASCKWLGAKSYDLGILFITTSRYIPFFLFKNTLQFIFGRWRLFGREEAGNEATVRILSTTIILALLFCTYDSQVNTGLEKIFTLEKKFRN